MMTEAQHKPVKNELSMEKRLELISTLNKLPLSQFLELEYTLNLPAGMIPEIQAEQGFRSSKLLGWVESSTGCGIGGLLNTLAAMGIELFRKTTTDQNSNRKRLTFKTEGDDDEVNAEKIQKLILELQKLVDEPSLQINRIKSESIEIELEGPEASLIRLKTLLDSGDIILAGQNNVGSCSPVLTIEEGDGLDLRWANLFGANLSGVNLISSNLNRASLLDADLSEANLRGSNLRSANLSGSNLSEANLSTADLRGANLRGSNFLGTNFSGANLSGINLITTDLNGANLNGANLSEANLTTASLNTVNLNGANLSGAELMGAVLSGANLSEANLSKANLGGAELFEANLNGANLGEADLSFTNLRGADLRKANLKGADLRRADLRTALMTGCQGLSEEQKADCRARGVIFEDRPSEESSLFSPSSPSVPR